MKTFMITAPSSNTGKTTLTLGLLRALKNRNLDVSAFKTGPDFIDTKYLEMASKKTAGNLDMHMMKEDGLTKSIALNKGEYGVIEGAMGYFDGVYNTFENSSYHMSNVLDVPAILVYRPKGEMFSVIPKIKGMVEFENSKIKGIILNQTSERMYELLKEQIEEYVDVAVLGYLPYDEELSIESRSLGLDDYDLEENKEIIIEKTAKILEETVDIDRLLEISEDISTGNFEFPSKRDIKIAIARDDAFKFYYNENLKILEEICEIEYFSILEDDSVPKADLVLIGGGYPELFLEELSKNTSMKDSLRKYIEDGGYLIAEGGGLMYLTDSIDDYPMLGIIKGKSIMTNRLDRFGYVNIHLEEDLIIGKKGDILKGNEFHKSRIETSEANVFQLDKPKSSRKWTCGYKYKNTLGYYQHINLLGNLENLEYLFDLIESRKKR